MMQIVTQKEIDAYHKSAGVDKKWFGDWVLFDTVY
jgi:hypothetical protein